MVMPFKKSGANRPPLWVNGLFVTEGSMVSVWYQWRGEQWIRYLLQRDAGNQLFVTEGNSESLIYYRGSRKQRTSYLLQRVVWPALFTPIGEISFVYPTSDYCGDRLRKPNTKAEAGTIVRCELFIEITNSDIVVNGIKIPGIHFQDQKCSKETIQTITEYYWNNSTECNQCTIWNEQKCMKMKLRGDSRGQIEWKPRRTIRS